MKLIKAACLSLFVAAIFAVPAVQAQSQAVMPTGAAHDTFMPPTPPPHIVMPTGAAHDTFMPPTPPPHIV
jgi:hypothetical protein